MRYGEIIADYFNNRAEHMDTRYELADVLVPSLAVYSNH
jgi:hypothetical protein